MTSQAPLHQRYRTLVEQIERDFAVALWRSGDIDLWPMARMDLFLDMFRSEGGDTSTPQASLLARTLVSLATPVTNLWKSRTDLHHWRPWPKRAYAVMLGDGVSLDRIDGHWQDRYSEPLIAILERQGLGTFLMQSGGPNRLPWRRPTFTANTLSVWGALMASLGPEPTLDLPDFEPVMAFLRQSGVGAPSLSRTRLARRVKVAGAIAAAFQRILRVAKPKLAFVVTYYAGLGHAFALACRREHVLCVDLQHCPQDGTHKAYSWRSLPTRGYSTMPALFWTWTRADAVHIKGWTKTLEMPWHQAVHGGHTQLASFLDAASPNVQAWDQRFDAMSRGTSFEREILVALQPIGGKRKQWDMLAAEIQKSPPRWRWWIRRHPSATPAQDREYSTLLALRQSNVVIDAAAAFPLPALLRRMTAVVSLMSGAAGEAAALGVPAFFLDPEAAGPFSSLIERGDARLIEIADLLAVIGEKKAPPHARATRAPPLEETLLRLSRMADAYTSLAGTSSESLPSST